MSRAGLALRAIRLTLKGAKADPTPDYDVASGSYDDYFTENMGRHSIEMLDQLSIKPGDAVVELACGTGHLTAEIARRLERRGSLRVVDISAGMLEVAKAKVAVVGNPGGSDDVELSLTQGDMESYLRAQPSGSATVIVIGWAICYSNPVRLLKDVVRVLAPGGQIGIIETRADALAALKRAFEDVVAKEPSLLRAMIDVSLPKDSARLSRWFEKAGLETDLLREGEQALPCTTGEEALEWVERSGAGAGFRDSFDVSRQDEIRQKLALALEARANADGLIDIRHSFVIGVAHKLPA